MRAKLQTVVDCTAGPATVSVEADLFDDGGSELDADLYRAMTKTLRGLADEARKEQERQLEIDHAEDARRLARLVAGLLTDRHQAKHALEEGLRADELPASVRELARLTVDAIEEHETDAHEAGELAARLR
jgi:hypothetical protein